MIWKNSLLDQGTIGEQDSGQSRCGVRISSSDIAIDYTDERGQVVYRGKDLGGGHYVLSAPERSGEATLHRAPGCNRLEGFGTKNRTMAGVSSSWARRN